MLDRWPELRRRQRSCPPTSLRHVREDIINAYAHFYSFAFQRELSRGNVLSVEYSGSRGEKLYSISPLNITGAGAFYLGDADPNSRLNNVSTQTSTRAAMKAIRVTTP